MIEDERKEYEWLAAKGDGASDDDRARMKALEDANFANSAPAPVPEALLTATENVQERTAERPTSLSEAQAIEANGGSPSSLTWPPRPNEAPAPLDFGAQGGPGTLATAVAQVQAAATDPHSHRYVRSMGGPGQQWACMDCTSVIDDPARLLDRTCPAAE